MASILIGTYKMASEDDFLNDSNIDYDNELCMDEDSINLFNLLVDFDVAHLFNQLKGRTYNCKIF